MKRLLILNGPNLNLLGSREASIYGDKSFESFWEELQLEYPNHDLEYFQSNIEGELVSKLQEANKLYDGVILNAAGYTHTSVAIRDAIMAIHVPVVEVHISNPYAREDFRQKSLIAGACKGLIAGFGLDSYKLAINSFK